MTDPAGAAPSPVVVIADDDLDVRHLVSVAVRRAGAVIGAEVTDGAAAIDAIRELRPALAILDVAMPELTGLQVCAQVRADPAIAPIKVMLLSAAVEPEAVSAGSAAGADLYATKPFVIKSLVAQIKALLSTESAG